MSPPLRIADHPVLKFEGRRRVVFRFDGRPIEAFEGDTVGAALHAAGQTVLSRSFKYHRPRGLLCVAGRCPNCLVGVDGTPSVRACVEPVRDGMEVRHQNAWPSLGFDALSLSALLPGPFLAAGFYYKTFIRPRWGWPYYEEFLRNAAGLGVVDPTAPVPEDYETAHLHADVAVAGGGPAGIAAALEAARLGARVVLLEAEAALGGSLRSDLAVHPAAEGHPGGRGFEVGRALAAAAEGNPAIEVRKGAAVFGVYEGRQLGAEDGRRLLKVRFGRLVVATGAIERPPVFANNDLPGIFLGSGARRLMHFHGVKPGGSAVVASCGDEGLLLAADLRAAGVRVGAVAVLAPQVPEGDPALAGLRGAGVPVLPGHAIAGARGRRRVRSALLREEGSGAVREVPCDTVCLAGFSAPLDALVRQAGGDPAVAAAGEVRGARGLAALLLDGRIAGAEAAIALGLGGDAARAEVEALRARAGGAAPAPAPLVGPEGARGKRIVCLCEDVTEKDVCRAVKEGFDHLELVKRYTAATMGPCQGRMCHDAAAAICARETGRTAAETGRTTARPPMHPVTLGALAGRNLVPRKTGPIHERHLALGAEMMDLGVWRRPRRYGDPADEARAVRERAGIIDVTSLGKIEVSGRDAARLLEKVYPCRFSDLKVGRIRYGVVCDDAGIVLDDGTVARLSEDRFYVTTSTGNVDAIEQWLAWWAAGTGWCVHVRNVTDAFAAMNLAGPRAREILSKTAGLDLSAAALPYLAAGQGTVAGAPAILLRIGFVGELGYEVHVPAPFGADVWDALMAAGKERGIAPFGVEAQRILRLEKGHIIVGQDTDALSNAIETGLSFAVKLDKPDFIGKRALADIHARPRQNLLVGFELAGAEVPGEGSQIVEAGRTIGRVTSCKRGVASGKVIGLAWVPAAKAPEGTPFAIRWEGRDLAARVAKTPFYDPSGARMKA